MNNYKQVFARKKASQKRWLDTRPNIPNTSGIYILTRTDEVGIKYAYIGQAKHLLSRLGEHLLGYQHIDLSIKKHGIKGAKNPYGWEIADLIETTELDEQERYFIQAYAHKGFQLRNKTNGGQDSGKVGINDNKPAKTYHDGLRQGRINALREIKVIFTKYLVAEISGKENKIKQRKLSEFNDILKSVD